MHKRISPHGDYDHMGEAINLVNNFKAEKVIFNCGPYNNLEKDLSEDIEKFLSELGNGFTFIKSEYPIKLNDRYNYIDLLLYNIKFKCYVVVELKVTELKKEHAGQIMTYMNYIDKNVKEITNDNTIGILIGKKENEYVIKYCSDDRIVPRKFEFV